MKDEVAWDVVDRSRDANSASTSTVASSAATLNERRHYRCLPGSSRACQAKTATWRTVQQLSNLIEARRFYLENLRVKDLAQPTSRHILQACGECWLITLSALLKG